VTPEAAAAAAIASIVVAIISLLGSVVAIRAARPKQQAEIVKDWSEAQENDAQTTYTLAQAAQLLGANYVEELKKARAHVDQQVEEIRLLNKRLDQVIEEKKRQEAHSLVVDRAAAELSSIVRRHAEHIVDLQDDLEAAKETVIALKYENAQLTAMYGDIVKENRRLTDEVARLTEENKKLTERIAELEQPRGGSTRDPTPVSVPYQPA